ncbi:hypothetical protein LLH00_04500 [bacterium]|nr:hypothetical protein [bacterium]
MRSTLFGQFLLERNIIDADQLKEALEYQVRNNRLLGKLALDKGFLSEADVRRVIERQWTEDKEFGTLSVELGILTPEQRDELLREQKSHHIPLGEALIALGTLSRETLLQSLDEYSASRDEAIELGNCDYCNAESSHELCFFSLLGKLLPRVTGGRFIPGGFYPTISINRFDVAISQRVRGQLDLEAVLLLPEALLESMALASLNGGGGSAQIDGRKPNRFERTVKGILALVVRNFICQQEILGRHCSASSGPRRISENTFRAHRSRARKVNCVEVILISPPAPAGDFLQFNICLLDYRDKD